MVTAHIVRIGNSRGIRIPRPILEQCRLEGTVTLEPRGDNLVIRPARKARQGWEDSFRKMARNGDDHLLDIEKKSSTKWDEKEWEW